MAKYLTWLALGALFDGRLSSSDALCGSQVRSDLAFETLLLGILNGGGAMAALSFCERTVDSCAHSAVLCSAAPSGSTGRKRDLSAGRPFSRRLDGNRPLPLLTGLGNLSTGSAAPGIGTWAMAIPLAAFRQRQAVCRRIGRRRHRLRRHLAAESRSYNATDPLYRGSSGALADDLKADDPLDRFWWIVSGGSFPVNRLR